MTLVGHKVKSVRHKVRRRHSCISYEKWCAVVISNRDNLPFSFSLTRLGSKSASVEVMQITEVPLDIIVPHQSIGVVMMQPFLEINFNDEPFIWLTNKADQQIALIERTLQLVIDRPANQHINFTIFPEYSVPGLNGIAAIERILSDNKWPVNSVVIAGIDGLKKADY